MRMFMIAAITATALSTQAHAGVVTGYVFTDQLAASSNATLAQFSALGGAGAANATFTFNGTANFDNRKLAPGDSAANTIDQFLGTGGVAAIGGATGAHILNNTYFYFTGSVGLHAGGNSFTITHDDGFEFNIDGIGIVQSTPGATAPVPATFNVNAPSTGNYNFQFSYGETSGGQAVVTVFGGTLQAVPESASFAILGSGLGLLGLGLRRRAQ